MVIGSMNPLVESIVHGGILHPKFSFNRGAPELLKDYIFHTLTTLDLLHLKPVTKVIGGQ
eukprot:Pgem_evm1s16116